MNKLIEQKVPKIAEINGAAVGCKSGSKKAVLTWIGEIILYDNKQQHFYLLKIIFKQFSLYIQKLTLGAQRFTDLTRIRI